MTANMKHGKTHWVTVVLKVGLSNISRGWARRPPPNSKNILPIKKWSISSMTNLQVTILSIKFSIKSDPTNANNG